MSLFAVTLLGNYLYDENESMVRYAEMLKKLLSARGIQVEIIRPEPFFGRIKRSSHGIGKWLGYIDKYILFPISLRRYIRRRKGDGFLVHICDQSNAVYTQWLKDVPHLVTCHDVMAIQSAHGMIAGQKTGWTGRLLQSWILSGLKNSYVVCVTQETRTDLLLLAPQMESHSQTIENPLNYPFAPMPKDEALDQLDMEFSETFRPGEDRFLFHVGGNQWYKNREGVIQIYAQLCASHPDWVRSHSLKLVMAGKPPTEAMRQLVQKEGVHGNVIFITSVSDQQLCAFYSLAEVLIYPSLKEGFGWPIIEAQACGCPVVTSDRAPMNRLAGPASLVADPEDKFDFAAKAFQIITESPEAQKSRKEGALQHSRSFDLQAYLEQIFVVYDKIGRKN